VAVGALDDDTLWLNRELGEFFLGVLTGCIGIIVAWVNPHFNLRV